MTKKSTASRAARSIAATGALNAIALADMGAEELVEGLLDGIVSDGSDEVIEAAFDDAGIVTPEANAADATSVNDDDLDAAIASAETLAATQAIYADGAEAPAEVVAPVVDAKAEAKAKKAADAANAKKIREDAKAAKAAAKALLPVVVKVPRATSITHKPGALLLAKLGANAAEYLTFSVGDAALSDEDRAAKVAAFVERMNDRDAIADKVREKITMFLTWVQKGGELNEVMKRAITVLHEKKELTSGDKGNLQVNLLSKPYSLGTARSQANQMFMAFPELGLVVKEKGRMVANPDSTLLPIAIAALKLA